DNRSNEPGWRVRVVPNKYPAVEAGRRSTVTSEHDGHMVLQGVGIHEIIIESPRHLTSVTQLTDAQLADVIGVYRQRLAELRRCGQFSDAVLFKNFGAGGGATLAHLHSQLV